jgi:hypothetical protein
MNNFSKIAIAALAFGGSISAASAAGVISSISASGDGLGSFNYTIDDTNRVLDLTKVFNSVDPIVLTFTVEHSTGPGNPYTVNEAITNSSSQLWTDFHYTIGEPDRGNGVVFTQHNNSVLSGFSLDQSSGPRNLDFSGNLASGSPAATAGFMISPFDPGQGNTMTFTLTQVPTIGQVPPVPEPETYAMLLAGLGLMGFMAKRRSSKQDA